MPHIAARDIYSNAYNFWCQHPDTLGCGPASVRIVKELLHPAPLTETEFEQVKRWVSDPANGIAMRDFSKDGSSYQELASALKQAPRPVANVQIVHENRRAILATATPTQPIIMCWNFARGNYGGIGGHFSVAVNVVRENVVILDPGFGIGYFGLDDEIYTPSVGWDGIDYQGMPVPAAACKMGEQECPLLVCS